VSARQHAAKQLLLKSYNLFCSMMLIDYVVMLRGAHSAVCRNR